MAPCVVSAEVYTADTYSSEHHTQEVQLGIVTLYMADVGVAYCISLYSTIKVYVVSEFLPWSPGHQQVSGVVTQSWTVFDSHSSKYGVCWRDHPLR